MPASPADASTHPLAEPRVDSAGGSCPTVIQRDRITSMGVLTRQEPGDLKQGGHS